MLLDLTFPFHLMTLHEKHLFLSSTLTFSLYINQFHSFRFLVSSHRVNMVFWWMSRACQWMIANIVSCAWVDECGQLDPLKTISSRRAAPYFLPTKTIGASCFPENCMLYIISQTLKWFLVLNHLYAQIKKGTPVEGRRIQQPKCCITRKNNKD